MGNICNVPGGDAKFMYKFYKKILYKKTKV
jgi:hypothetical protein